MFSYLCYILFLNLYINLYIKKLKKYTIKFIYKENIKLNIKKLKKYMIKFIYKENIKLNIKKFKKYMIKFIYKKILKSVQSNLYIKKFIIISQIFYKIYAICILKRAKRFLCILIFLSYLWFHIYFFIIFSKIYYPICDNIND